VVKSDRILTALVTEILPVVTHIRPRVICVHV